MTQTQKILLCGSSLFIAGLQTSLEMMEGLELSRVEAQADLLHKRLCAELPSVLILEIGSIPGDFSLTLLKDFPHLMLIGLDLESNRLLVFSVQQETPLAASDLVRVIRERGEELEGEDAEVTAHLSHHTPGLAQPLVRRARGRWRARTWVQVLRTRRKKRGK